MTRRFSQKHYIEVAKLLKALNDKAQGCKIALCDIDKEFIKLFSADSDKFNVDKFLKAIGYSQEQINHSLLRARPQSNRPLRKEDLVFNY